MGRLSQFTKLDIKYGTRFPNLAREPIYSYPCTHGIAICHSILSLSLYFETRSNTMIKCHCRPACLKQWLDQPNILKDHTDLIILIYYIIIIKVWLYNHNSLTNNKHYNLNKISFLFFRITQKSSVPEVSWSETSPLPPQSYTGPQCSLVKATMTSGLDLCIQEIQEDKMEK